MFGKASRSGGFSDKFDKFTKRAREVLSLAQEEAQQLNHNDMGTEHLLLGLVREGEGVAAKALQSLGVELDEVRRGVLFIIGRGDRVVLGEIGMTPRAKKVLELAVDETRRLNHHYIGTEHILLGIIREGDGIGASVLVNMGITLDRTRKEVLRILNQGTAEKAAESSAPKNNVVTCRLDDAAACALDALVEAGIRSTRSEAAAWLISAGIEAHRALFDRVNTTVNEIRKLRLEARDIARQVTRDVAEKVSPESDEAAEDDVKDPEEPEDLDDLTDLDEPPTA
jgi:ATP-dependent Clp protease ATP-binding subunit ClpA